jgi:hypothetical protein
MVVELKSLNTREEEKLEMPENKVIKTAFGIREELLGTMLSM